MDDNAFVSGLPTHLNPVKSRCVNGLGIRNNRSSPIRATASTPDRPSNNGDDNSLEQSRAAFEKMLNREMQPRDGRTGQCECIWCNGTKQRKCSWCDGKGVREEFVNKSWEQISQDIERMQNGEGPQFMEAPNKVPVQCSACSGTKKLRCAYCRGSGTGSYGHSY